MSSSLNRNSLSDTRPVERLFFIMSLGFGLIGAFAYFLFPNSALDLQMHDTYWVVAIFHIPLLFALSFLLQGLVFLICRKIGFELFASLGHAQFWFIIFATIIMLLNLYFSYFSPASTAAETTPFLNPSFWTAIIFALLGLLMLIINFGTSLIGWILAKR